MVQLAAMARHLSLPSTCRLGREAEIHLTMEVAALCGYPLLLVFQDREFLAEIIEACFFHRPCIDRHISVGEHASCSEVFVPYAQLPVPAVEQEAERDDSGEDEPRG